MSKPLSVALLGCGNIAPAYLENQKHFPNFEITALADLSEAAREQMGEKYGIEWRLTPDQLFADERIDCIVNLTPPVAHHAVTSQALQSGKHVYSEKPIAMTIEEADALLELAMSVERSFCCAPDIFLGPVCQTAQQFIQSGQLGDIIGAEAHMMGGGPDGWHPNPKIFYTKGGGPLLDMGAYYLSYLIELMGPIETYTAAAAPIRPNRTIPFGDLKGERFDNASYSHISGLLRHQNGASSTLTTSFDSPGSKLPNLEIYGSSGTLRIPDPNHFEGELIHINLQNEERVLPQIESIATPLRGIGLNEMAAALRSGQRPATHASKARDHLALMTGMMEAAEKQIWKTL